MSNQKSSKEKLLKDFDGVFKRSKPFLVSRLGDSWPTIIEEIRREYETLIPLMPDFGGMEPFTRYIRSAAQYTASYRVLQRHGMSLEESGQFIYDFTEAFMKSYPRLFLRALSGDIYSKKMRNKAKEMEKTTHLREYPDNYVLHYIEGNGGEYDFAIQYSECAVCKFQEKIGAPELTPYICMVDKISSDLFNWGLHRKMIIAEGDPICDFRFKKGTETDITSKVIRLKY